MEQKYNVVKRTFKAKEFPVGSDARAVLNKDVETSEYQSSHKYAIKGPHITTSYRTKEQADETAERWNKEQV